MKTLRRYQKYDGSVPFSRWLETFKDRTTKARITARLDRVENGNFGDHKNLGHGISELRLTFGPGYRIYYGEDGAKIVILLVGGNKSSQIKDIETAKFYWNDYQERKNE